MAVDRCVRSLGSLGGASTSRVLNLLAISERRRDDAEYAKAPLFLSPVVNSSIILKHRIRSDESYLFSEPRSIATKIIVPFDKSDLRLGGRSLFVEQRGFVEAIEEIGNYKNREFGRDLEILRLIDQIPSLDPFLLREHLKAHQIEVSACYFEISSADQTRMYEFAAQHMRSLISLANNTATATRDPATAKLVTALLSNDVNEKLEPLRATLMLDHEEFREGVFSWRGFLYYKWSMNSFWPQIGGILREVQRIKATGSQSPDQAAYLSQAKRRIIQAVRDAGREIAKVLKIYDDAYADLVRSGQPKAFREFLLSAPHMFLQLGERTGAISHLASFWRYRFRSGTIPYADAEELCAMFQDFESGFGHSSQQQAVAAAW